MYSAQSWIESIESQVSSKVAFWMPTVQGVQEGENNMPFLISWKVLKLLDSATKKFSKKSWVTPSTSQSLISTISQIQFNIQGHKNNTQNWMIEASFSPKSMFALTSWACGSWIQKEGSWKSMLVFPLHKNLLNIESYVVKVGCSFSCFPIHPIWRTLTANMM